MVDLAALNPQQREAVRTIAGPVLILAGAGTGKTKVITSRIGYLIDQGIPPSQILAVTFTNKAAREMQERVRPFLSRAGSSDQKANRPTISTFHSLCVRILRQHIQLLGYKRNFVIYTESDQLALVKKILSHISAKGEKVDPAEVLSMISKLRNDPDSTRTLTAEGAAMGRHVQQKYELALKACNAVDFDDLILLTLLLFREHPESLEICRQKYRYVMVDEYQDTNRSQFQLIHNLTIEHQNLCVVGDDDQSIYGWRGAEIANLLEMEKYYPRVKVIKLEQNYRSTGTILEAANALIKNNPRRRPKKLWSAKGVGARLQLHCFSSDEVEARTIIELIETNRLMKRGTWSDHAILFRTNQQSRALEMACRKAQVKYHLIGGPSYFDRREIKDFLAYLRAVINPHDDISLLRIANVPARGLSDVTMERLLGASQERDCSVHAAMQHTDVQSPHGPKAAEAIRALNVLLESARTELASETVKLSDWSLLFLERINYWAEIRRSEKTAEAAESRIRNLKELVATMDGSAHGPALERLSTFLEEITLDQDREEEKENKGDAVTLITMHSCKGLEFPHVFITGVEEGLLPHSRSAVEGTLDEERRLFYVALTRAMITLSLSYCDGRMRYGSVVPCHPSRFLKELPPELMENGDEQSKQPVAIQSGKSLFNNMRTLLGE